MSLTLGPLFDRPLHPPDWCSYGALRGTPGCPRLDYRVTNGFDGRDLVNGGLHHATDVGNASKGHAVLSPANRPMRHLAHFDGARGREWDLGAGVMLRAWHLAPHADDPKQAATGTSVGPWRDTVRGEVVGFTGNSGGKLAGGGVMPAHTHIELTRGALVVDAEPYLLGEPIEGVPDDMARFVDVPPDHRFYDAIEWIAEQGISGGIAGTDPPEFRPDAPVTRGQLAAFLQRFRQLLD